MHGINLLININLLEKYGTKEKLGLKLQKL
jgi:hypothetical protein